MVTKQETQEADILPGAEDVASLSTEGESTSEEQAEVTQVVDWQKRAQELEALTQQLEAERQKALNDFKAVSTGSLKQSERDRRMDTRLTNIERKQDALLRATSTGETEKLATDMATIQRETAEQEWTDEVAKAREDIFDSVRALDEEGQLTAKVLYDVNTEPAFENVRQTYTEATKTGDSRLLDRAVKEAQKVARQLEHKRAKTAIETVKVQASAEATKTQREEQAEAALNLNTGRSAASPNESLDVLIKKDISDMSIPELQKLKQQILNKL